MSKRLLVVEDNSDSLSAIAFYLRSEGFEINTARNGADALAQIVSEIPDLIVSDIRMPKMNGYKLARHLRSTPHTALIPIIFLTAYDKTENRIKGFRAGIDAYLTKPFEPEELVAIINCILDRVERTRAELTRLVSETELEEEIQVADEELTEAEKRIAGAVSRGLSNKDIANEFELSVRTVENHISRILAKKNFSNRVEIARLVLENAHSATG
ncbi:MAG TPA: response regulator transcription factor [Pyrinomonadaceae bacterium]|nr:response regulator transcription factor [Pyrinomonadaceae bacterium]